MLLARAATLRGMSVRAYLRQTVLDTAPDPAAAGKPSGQGLIDVAADQTVASWRWELSQQQPAHQPKLVPAQARALARAALSTCGLDGHADVCMMLISELVTNAVRHGGRGPVTVQLMLNDRQLVCGVGDTSRAPPVPGSPGLDDEGGRGLALLAELSSSCGWYQTGTGKTVWFAQHLNRSATGAPRPNSTQAAFPTTAGPAHPTLATSHDG
ncbi:ATP-binding protein [Actinomadura sp. 6N118]|uniref:ATP-binding protein n=1 Tax=Actinomadura sp. 6N118 TaxID=3375151 RepID=UPI0037945340